MKTIRQVFATSLLLGLMTTVAQAEDTSVFRQGVDAIKDTGKTIGHTTRDVTKKIGHATRDTTKEIGHATRDAAKDVKESVTPDK